MNCRVWLFAASFAILAVEWTLAATVFMGRAPDIQGGVGSCGSFSGMFQPGNTNGDAASRSQGFTVQLSFQPDAADIPAPGGTPVILWEMGDGSSGHSILIADAGSGPQLHFLAKDGLSPATAVPFSGTWINTILNVNHPTAITAGTPYDVLLVFDPDNGAGLLNWSVNGVNITPTGPGANADFDWDGDESFGIGQACTFAGGMDNLGGLFGNTPQMMSAASGLDVQWWQGAPPIFDLAVSKIVSSDPVTDCGNLIYTITVQNLTNTLVTGLVVTDTLDPDLVFVGASAGGSMSMGVVSWNIPSLAGNTSTDVFITTRVDCVKSSYTNLVLVTPDCGDVNPANNTNQLVHAGTPMASTLAFDTFPPDTSTCGGSTTNLFGIPTSSNPCTVSTSRLDTISASPCGFDVERVWTLEDGCGASLSQTQMIAIVNVSAPPTLTIPGDVDICDPAVEITTFAANATALDNCGSLLPVTFVNTATPTACGSEVIRVYTATDFCGNSNTATQRLVNANNDAAPPTFTVPPNLTGCNLDTSVAGAGMITDLADDCSTPTVTMMDTIVSNTACLTVIQRTWIATDACGLSTTGSQTITSTTDTTRPVFNVFPPDTNGCNIATDPANTGSATAMDNCGTVTVMSSDITTLAGGNVMILRTWTATDPCGNSTSRVQTISSASLAAGPVLMIPPDITVCNNATNPVDTGTASGLSSCCGMSTVTFADIVFAGAGDCGGDEIQRLWTGVDECARSITLTQIIVNVTDTNAPIVTAPANVSQINADTTPAATGTATATDDSCTVSTNFADVVVNTVCGIEITRTWTVEDVCGNPGTAVQFITNLVDSTPPVFATFPPDTNGCNLVTTTNITGVATITDACSTFTLTFVDRVTMQDCVQVTAREWIARDSVNNQTSRVQLITSTIDTTPPVITVNNASGTNINTSVASVGSAVASDDCSVASLTSADFLSTNGCVLSVARVWTATDACGNVGLATQMIDNLIDAGIPVFTFVPGPVEDCNLTDTSPAAFGTATATDTCCDVTITFEDVVAVVDCEVTTIRNWIATDCAGNVANAPQTIVNRIDLDAPRLIAPPDITVCSTNCSTNVTGGVTVIDGCAPTPGIPAETRMLTVQRVQLGESSRSIGTGGPLTGIFSIAELYAEGNGNVPNEKFGAVNFAYTPGDFGLSPMDTITSLNSIDLTLTFNDRTFSAGNNVQFFFTTDDLGANNFSRTFNPGFVNGIDPGQFTYAPVSIGNYITGYIPDGTDTNPQGGQAFTYTLVFPPAVQADLLAEIRNGSEFSILVGSLGPNDAITFSGVGNTFDPGDPRLNIQLGAEVTDVPAVAGYILDFAETTNAVIDCGLVLERVWTATDSCGNAASATQLVTCVEPTPIVASVPANISGCGLDLASLGSAVTVTSCSGITTSLFETIEQIDCRQEITRIWTFADVCNTITVQQVVTNILDFDAPVLTIPADMNFCGIVDTSPVNTGMATALDGCSAAVTITNIDVVTNIGCGVRIERTWIASDDCGNTNTGIQVINAVTNPAPPVFTVQPADTNGCNLVTSNLPDAVATSCVPITTSFDEVITTVGCTQTIVRSWSFENFCGTITHTQIVTNLIDNDPPVITLPFDDFFCGTADVSPTAAGAGVATAVDSCSAVTITSVDEQFPIDCGFFIERTWIATDDCENESIAVQFIDVITNAAAPTVTFTPDDFAGCNIDIDALPDATATGCSETFANLTVDTVVSGCVQTITRIWTFENDCDLVETEQVILNTIDVDPPNLSIPSNVFICGMAMLAPGPASPTGEASATDPCSGTAVTFADTTNTVDCGLLVSRVWSAADGCGNVSIDTQLITVAIAPAAPVVTFTPADMVACNLNLTNLTNATATGCLMVATNYDQTVDYIGCTQFWTRTWTFANPCTSTSVSQNVTIIGDLLPPLLIIPPDEVICGAITTAPSGVVSVTDECSAVTITSNDLFEAVDCGERLTRTYIATDQCGNSTTGRHTVLNVLIPRQVFVEAPDDAFLCDVDPSDLLPPLETGPPVDMASTVVLGDRIPLPIGPWDEYNLSAGAVDLINVDGGGIGSLPFGTINDEGTELGPNRSSKIQTFTTGTETNGYFMRGFSVQHVAYTTDTPPGTFYDVQTGDSFELNLGRISNGVPSSVIVNSTTAGATGPGFTDTVEGTNSTGRWIHFTFSGTVVLQPNTEYYFEIATEFGDPFLELAGTLDDTAYPGGTALRGPGNGANMGPNDGVLHNQNNPTGTVVSVNGDRVFVARLDARPGVPDSPVGVATATGGCTGLTLGFTDTTVDQPFGAEITRVWTATDRCGASGVATQMIINADIGAVPMLVSAPDDRAICSIDFEPLTGPEVTSTLPLTTNLTIETLAISDCADILTRTWDYSTECGAMLSVTQIVTNVQDFLPPTIEVPEDFADCNMTDLSPAITGNAMGFDDCGIPTVEFSDRITTNGCLIVVERTWTATDACDEEASAVQLITNTLDVTSPMIQTFEAASVCYLGTTEPAFPVPTATATDDCMLRELSLDIVTNVNGCVETREYNWTAVDNCGNFATATLSQMVTNDATFAITAPADVSGRDISTIPADSGMATVISACIVPVITFTDTVAVVECVQTITRLWQAESICGNTLSATQTIINIQSTADPIVVAPPNAGGCNIDTSVAAQGTALATACGPFLLEFDDVITQLGCTTVVQRIWTAIAQDGSAGSDTQILVNVVDTTRPVVTAPPDRMGCNLDISLANADMPMIDEDCDFTMRVTDATRVNPCDVTIVRTYVVTDVCGNFSVPVSQRIVSLTDDTPPVISCPTFEVIILPEADGSYLVPEILGVFTSDGCSDTLEITQNPAPGSVMVGDAVLVTIRVSDDCGNASECIRTVRRGNILGGTVFLDCDSDGAQGAAGANGCEMGVSNVVVEIRNGANMATIASSTTDANGSYSFVVDPTTVGSIQVFIDPASNDLGPLGADSIVPPEGGLSDLVTVQIGEDQMDLDAGILPFSDLVGFIWEDLNNNGTTDENLSLTGVNGIDINLYQVQPDGSLLFFSAWTSRTAENGEQGEYEFSNLPPGDYVIELDQSDLPAELSLSEPSRVRRRITIEPNVDVIDVDTVGNFGLVPEPTAVTISSLDATQGSVLWSVSAEWDVLGYNVIDATGAIVNESIILATGGGDYRLDGVGEGTYVLQELTTDLRSNPIGTVIHYPEVDATPVGQPTKTVQAVDGEALLLTTSDSNSYLVLGVSDRAKILDVTNPDHPVRLMGEVLERPGGKAMYFSYLPNRQLFVQ